MAARQVRSKALRIAAHALEVAEADLEWKDGAAVVRGAPDRALPLRRRPALLVSTARHRARLES